MKDKKPRTPNDIFKTSELYDMLAVHAKDKDTSWDFEGLSYQKGRRGLGPDRAGLEFYAVLLTCILMVAPYGQPSKQLLKIVWDMLDKKYGIRKTAQKNGSSHERWLDETCDLVRVMTGHVKDLKVSPGARDYCKPKVQALIDMVKIYATVPEELTPVNRNRQIDTITCCSFGKKKKKAAIADEVI